PPGSNTSIDPRSMTPRAVPRAPDVELSFSTRVQHLVRRIPRGRVLAYGDVAALRGTLPAARVVGPSLSSLPAASDVPGLPAVNARGRISLHGHPGLLQRMMLDAEGVKFGRGGSIDWRRFGWNPDQRAGGRGPLP